MSDRLPLPGGCWIERRAGTIEAVTTYWFDFTGNRCHRLMSFAMGKAVWSLAEMVERGRVVTCVYCGHQYENGTPESQDERLTTHISACEKHPMRKAEARITELERHNAMLRAVAQAHVDDLRSFNNVVDRVAPGLPESATFLRLVEVLAAGEALDEKDVQS